MRPRPGPRHDGPAARGRRRAGAGHAAPLPHSRHAGARRPAARHRHRRRARRRERSGLRGGGREHHGRARAPAVGGGGGALRGARRRQRYPRLGRDRGRSGGRLAGADGRARRGRLPPRHVAAAGGPAPLRADRRLDAGRARVRPQGAACVRCAGGRGGAHLLRRGRHVARARQAADGPSRLQAAPDAGIRADGRRRLLRDDRGHRPGRHRRSRRRFGRVQGAAQPAAHRRRDPCRGAGRDEAGPRRHLRRGRARRVPLRPTDGRGAARRPAAGRRARSGHAQQPRSRAWARAGRVDRPLARLPRHRGDRGRAPRPRGDVPSHRHRLEGEPGLPRHAGAAHHHLRRLSGREPPDAPADGDVDLLPLCRAKGRARPARLRRRRERRDAGPRAAARRVLPRRLPAVGRALGHGAPSGVAQERRCVRDHAARTTRAADRGTAGEPPRRARQAARPGVHLRGGIGSQSAVRSSPTAMRPSTKLSPSSPRTSRSACAPNSSRRQPSSARTFDSSPRCARRSSSSAVAMRRGTTPSRSATSLSSTRSRSIAGPTQSGVASRRSGFGISPSGTARPRSTASRMSVPARLRSKPLPTVRNRPSDAASRGCCWAISKMASSLTTRFARHVALAGRALAPGGDLAHHGQLGGLAQPHLEASPCVLGRHLVGLARGQHAHLLGDPTVAPRLGQLAGELAAHVAQMGDVGERVGQLALGERAARPVGEARRLVEPHLGDAHDELIVRDLVAIAQHHRRDLRVEQGRGHHATQLHHDLHVLPRGVEDLHHSLVRHQVPEGLHVEPVGERIDDGRASLRGDLDEAELGVVGRLAQELGVHRHEGRVDHLRAELGQGGAVGDGVGFPRAGRRRRFLWRWRCSCAPR